MADIVQCPCGSQAERCDLCRLAYLRYWDIEAREVVKEVAA